ncbi:response regulator [Hymenobacter terrenus]|uniref:response regulator n=1 Tax=Hymenobacter terrenus TaxID=1629124 RepID=UPI000B21F95E|nr:response regulator [Hymenobacter terrenus]
MPPLSNVLLIDDDRTTNFLNKALLTRMGVAQQVLTAENGAGLAYAGPKLPGPR